MTYRHRCGTFAFSTTFCHKESRPGDFRRREPALVAFLSAEQQRSRVQEFLAALHTQWEEAEVQLHGQIERLQEERDALQAELDAERPRGRTPSSVATDSHREGAAEPLRSQAGQRSSTAAADLEEQLQTARYCEKELAAEVERFALPATSLSRPMPNCSGSSRGRSLAEGQSSQAAC